MEEEYLKVKTEVQNLTGKHKESGVIHKITTINFNDRKIIYGCIFSLVFLLLIFVRPSFLYVKNDNEDNKKFSFSKLILYTIILSVILVIFYEFLERRKFLKT